MKTSHSTLFKRLFYFMGSSGKLVAYAAVCALISVAASLLGPLLIGFAVDDMAVAGQVDFNAIARIIAGLAVIYGIGSLFTWLLTYLTNRIAFKMVRDIRQQLFEKMNTLPLKYFDGNPHGDIISRFINDMDAVSEGVLQGLSTLLTSVFTLVGSILLMLTISGWMTAVVLLSTPLAFFVARFITTRSQMLFKEQARLVGQLNGYAEEIINGQKVVKAFGYEGRSFEKFSALNEELKGVGVKSQYYSSLTNPATRLVNNTTYTVVGVIGSITAIMGGISVGGISSFLIYSNLFAKPFNEITGVLSQLQAALASSQRIFAVLDQEPEISDAKNALNLEETTGKVNFDKVRFSYQPERPLIKNFNLAVKPGSRIAVVGRTGAGKTTLVNLLMRFYEVDGGTISIDGTDITHITRDSLRKNIGMVLQDTWLFSGTVRENITYGKPDAKEEAIIAAAKAADAHSFIRRLPEGYDTVISDGGDNLSQGQKQLLTIARVMLADPPMLILDEATSSIDTLTEIRIQKAFLKMMEGRTSFVIAHRLSTIREADLILVMENGDVAESGNHEELLMKKGLYASLYNSQFTQG